MSEPIIPNNEPPTPDPAPTPGSPIRTIVCECCGSKLDRRGGLLRRGELAKQMIDTEDKLDALRKSLAKSEDALNAARQEIDSLKAQLPKAKRSLWDREA